MNGTAIAWTRIIDRAKGRCCAEFDIIYIWSFRYDCPAKTNGLLEKSKLRELIEPDAFRAFILARVWSIRTTFSFRYLRHICACASANCANCTYGQFFLIIFPFYGNLLFIGVGNKFHFFLFRMFILYLFFNTVHTL